MNEAFDLRLKKDRETLANYLPTIDNYTFIISRRDFIEALSSLSLFLREPEWLIYQYGTLGPIPTGSSKLVFSLSRACELGMWLRDLSIFRDFDKLLVGFSNPTQFEDSCFEAKVAHWFSTLPAVGDIIFSPSYLVNGRFKNPDFDVNGIYGSLTVECKQPHHYVQQAFQKFNNAVSEFQAAMKKREWPDHLRLEIEMIGNIKESLQILAQNTIDIALKTSKKWIKRFSYKDTVRGFLVKRKSSFRITNVKVHTDIMIIGDKATGLLNPEFTILRVGTNRLDALQKKSIGSRIADALHQLSKDRDCIIFVGGVPYRIAEPACQDRLSDKAYSHVRAFGAWDDELKFVYRRRDKAFIRSLLGI
jgi:uncharacterized protein YaaR (DUF327 family)